MLRVTRDAAHLIRSLVARHAEIPRTGGLRIVTNPDSHALSMGLASSAEASDVVVADHGARLFLSVTAAARLQDRTLDAQVTGSRSAFFLDR